MKNQSYKILSIDPGQTTLGFAVSTFTPASGSFHVNHFNMIESIKLAKKEMKDDYKQFGNLISLSMLEREFRRLMDNYKPDFVCSEDAFYSPRTPNAFISLKLCIHTMGRVLYDTYKQHLYLIAPKLAKQTVSKGTADKLAVQNAILSIPSLTIKDTKLKPITCMTEHEADSIAIGYTFCKVILPDLLFNSKL